MRDIAARVGVHQTTVSLALRHHPSIPAHTRERIVEVAREVGYRPNPLLNAFNFHRVASHPVKGAPVLAMVFDARMHPRSTDHEYPRLLFQAARDTARERGYQLEPFVLQENGLHSHRLNRVLVARGITGVIISTLGLETTQLELDWPRLCTVKIESLHVQPALDAVSSDQWQAARTGLRRLRELGYRRVGLIAAADDEARLGEPFRTGMLVEQAAVPEAERVPSLLFAGRAERDLGQLIDAWVREHRIEAVMSNWNNVIDHLRAKAWQVPSDIAVASLDAPLRQTDLAGVVQNHELVGRRAVEQVLLQLQAHQRGVPQTASVTFVPGRWRDGASAPKRG